jgi:hypothetical protein
VEEPEHIAGSKTSAQSGDTDASNNRGHVGSEGAQNAGTNTKVGCPSTRGGNEASEVGVVHHTCVSACNGAHSIA